MPNLPDRAIFSQALGLIQQRLLVARKEHNQLQKDSTANRYRITELEVAEITLRKEYERAADDDDLAADEVKLTPGGLAICRWCRYPITIKPQLTWVSDWAIHLGTDHYQHDCDNYTAGHKPL